VESALEGVALSSRIFSGWVVVEHTEVSRMTDLELRRFCLIVTGLEVMIHVYAFQTRVIYNYNLTYWCICKEHWILEKGMEGTWICEAKGCKDKMGYNTP
jgi:hypothetical protein